jgi:hypothetical protein
LLILVTGCPQAAAWRDAQIAQSKSIAQGDRVEPPQPPIAVPKDVAAELPLHDTFIITQYTATSSADSVTVCALSQWDTEQTALWMLTELDRMGYQAEHNPSEVLNGLDVFNDQLEYQNLTVKVTMNNSGQCLVRLDAAKP